MLRRILNFVFLAALNTMLLAPVQATPDSANELDSRMAALQSRIAVLKQGGTGVAPFQKIFDEIDVLVKAGKTEDASQLISNLNTKLSTQENLRDQAKRQSAARVVKVQQVSVPVATGSLAVSKQSSVFSDSTGHKSLGDKINCMKMNLQQMQTNLGMSVGEFQSRIAAVEQQKSLSPEAASAALDKIGADIAKACQARNPVISK